MSKNNHLVIMAGGIGSRFWPLSSENKPKQFLDVLGVGKTLLQLTLERFSSIVPKENVWIVTSKEYKDLVLEQLQTSSGAMFCWSRVAETQLRASAMQVGESSQSTLMQILSLRPATTSLLIWRSFTMPLKNRYSLLRRPMPL